MQEAALGSATNIAGHLSVNKPLCLTRLEDFPSLVAMVEQRERGREIGADTRPVRYGAVIGVRPDAIEHYEQLHRNVPEPVLATIARCNIVNYSIFRYGTQLFSYFEYVGEDYAADMAAMAADPDTRAWWQICMPLQEQTPDKIDGSWWTPVPEVFHVD